MAVEPVEIHESGEVVNFEEEKLKRMDTPLKLITGGDGQGPTGNWLLDLAENTQFIVADKLERANFMCLRMEIMRKVGEPGQPPKAAWLWVYPTEEFDTDGKPFGLVHAGRFVNRFELINIISVPGADNPEK